MQKATIVSSVPPTKTPRATPSATTSKIPAHQHINVQHPTSAVNVTLLAFAAKCNLLLCAVLRRRCCWTPNGRRCRAIFPASTALSSKPAAAAGK